MSILATMFAELFDSQCSARLSKGFIAAFATNIKFAKARKPTFFVLNDGQKISQLLVQRSIMLK